MDYYNTLGVNRNASPDEIKKAYRRLAGQHHPDKGGDTATFQKIQEAYETLSDPEKKQQFDNPNPFGGMHGGSPFGNPFGRPGGMNFGFPGGNFQFHTDGNPNGGFDDIFSQMFGHQQRNQQQSYRTAIWLTLEQVYNGGEQTLQFQTPQGGMQNVKIQIPKGIVDGGTLRYDNLIKDGILLIEFRIHPHPKFERSNNNLRCTQEIDIFDLIVGSTFKFTTISGKTVDVVIKPNTKPDTVLKLEKHGLPVHNRMHEVGDQYILIKPILSDTIDLNIIDAINKSKNR
jgi:curved DNA-binding protein